ncbi:MAG: PQQ-dependent sugar dehydrogenase, partial [Pseudobdellovibrionaceae bacterium]
KLPEGAQVSIFAVVPSARSMSLGEKGQIFVGTRDSRVYRIWDPNLDGKADRVEVLFDQLKSPNGVAYKNGDLYIGEIPRILKVSKVNETKKVDLKVQVLPQKFPSDGHHGWKVIRFGPDGWLYVPVGANCNVCDPGTEYARMFRIDVTSDKKEEVAQGIRNTVGYDWDPKTKELWFTDNGRDLLGDDVPPDEINKVSKKVEHFGFPFCHGKDVQDSGFKKPCSQFTLPQVLLPAHVAPLGMRFHKDQIYFAEHGSWNRSKPQGYRVSRVVFSKGQAPRYEPWIEGWLQGTKSWGRPVDVQIYFDGSLLISDDEAGVIYRVQGL